MNRLKIWGIVFIFGMAMTFLSGIGDQFSIPGVQHLISPAHARVGRPLTPVSVAGVARRTVRRCAVGVYHCNISTPNSLDSLAMQNRVEPSELNSLLLSRPM